MFDNDHQLAGFVRRLIGAALVASVTENVLPIFWGGGANGKSVFVETVLSVLGSDYAMKAPPGMFMARRNETHPTERTDLFGKRFVAAVETVEGGKLDETMVKELTGGDTIRAQRMRQDMWEFKPSHTAIMVTNHKPRVDGTDNGVWRRVRLVPFVVRFWNPDDPPAKAEDRPAHLRQDKRLRENLAAEAPGILAWAVRACLEWQRDGLGAPKAVAAATAEYREESDQVGRFVAECCDRVNDTACRSRSSTLYSTYRDWCEEGGEEWISAKKFGPELERLGFRKVTSNGV